VKTGFVRAIFVLLLLGSGHAYGEVLRHLANCPDANPKQLRTGLMLLIARSQLILRQNVGQQYRSSGVVAALDYDGPSFAKSK
jgi:hypothetical protein